MAVAVLYLIIAVPYEMGFEPTRLLWQMIFEWTLDVSFILDLFLNFRTGYLDEHGRVVMDPRKCAKHYLKDWFLLDFISSLPPVIENISRLTDGDAHGSPGTSGSRLTRLLRIGRMLRGFKLVRILRLIQVGTSNSTTRDVIDDVMAAWTTKFFNKLFNMTICAFLLSHLLACFFAVSGLAPLKHYEPFQSSAAIEWPIRRQYTAMLYWAWSTMTTVGFGDVVAESHNNRVYAIIAMFLGSSFYSYVIAMAASIVGSGDAKQSNYFHRMEQLNSWMTHHHFPAHLRRHIRRYFRHRFERRTALNERLIMDELEPHLQEAVAEELLHDTVKTNDLFDALPRATLSKLIPIISEIAVRDGAIIVERGKRTSSFFILAKGQADLFDPLIAEDPVLVGPGDSFGELALLGVRSTSQCTVTALSDVMLYVLQRDKFVDAFKHLPEHLNRMQAKCAEKAISRVTNYHDRHHIPISGKTALSIARLEALAQKDCFHHDDHFDHHPTTEDDDNMNKIFDDTTLEDPTTAIIEEDDDEVKPRRSVHRSQSLQTLSFRRTIDDEQLTKPRANSFHSLTMQSDEFANFVHNHLPK